MTSPSDALCEETGRPHNYTADLEYDATGQTINCEDCGEPQPQDAGNYGDATFRKLMDLGLLLQDGDQMVGLKLFLGSMDLETPALRKLRAEIEKFTARIEGLTQAAKVATGME
jgi:hypothetical protein